jgi:alkylhydroperoxidase/carboxymuconolactone decarboxylase family protein YurZ
MSNQQPTISEAFLTFQKEAPQHTKVWAEMIFGMADASALDDKTKALAYLAVLAVLRLEGGVPSHVQVAKKFGASRDEVISAILIGLPAAGHQVTQVLPTVVKSYDESE